MSKRAPLTPTYQASILPEEEPEVCPRECIMRYSYDGDNWIEVTVGERGVEIRTNGGDLVMKPLSGNNIEVFLRERT